MTPTLRQLRVHPDERGSVREAYRASWFPGVPPVVQVVHSESRRGVLRGMHAHKRQYDIWHFTAGRAVVFLYDHRTGEYDRLLVGPTSTVAIPPGVSHGFYALEPVTLTYYLTEEYDGTDEFGWDAYSDDWPGLDDLPLAASVIRSDRDRNAPHVADFAAAWDMAAMAPDTVAQA